MPTATPYRDGEWDGWPSSQSFVAPLNKAYQKLGGTVTNNLGGLAPLSFA